MTENSLESEDVRIAYANEWDSYFGWQFIDSKGEEFDLWLNEIRAEAWDEGVTKGVSAHCEKDCDPKYDKQFNPYRTGEK